MNSYFRDKHEFLKFQNSKLKDQLKNLSIQIETAITKNKTSGFRNLENIDKPFLMGEFLALQNNIKKYKEF